MVKHLMGLRINIALGLSIVLCKGGTGASDSLAALLPPSPRTLFSRIYPGTGGVDQGC